MGNKCTVCRCTNEETDLSKEANLIKQSIKPDIEKIIEEQNISSRIISDINNTSSNSYAEKFKILKLNKKIKINIMIVKLL